MCDKTGLQPTLERMATVGGKSLTSSGGGGIISAKKIIEVQDVHYIGKLDKRIIEKEFGMLQTDEIVLTDERVRHIKERHIEDYELFEKNKIQIVYNPDIIIKDEKNENTIFMIKRIEETNMNIIVKLAVVDDEKHSKNSIMTAYRIRDKNLKKLENKNKTLYKHE